MSIVPPPKFFMELTLFISCLYILYAEIKSKSREQRHSKKRIGINERHERQILRSGVRFRPGEVCEAEFSVFIGGGVVQFFECRIKLHGIRISDRIGDFRYRFIGVQQ